jgi:hypothetical protein
VEFWPGIPSTWYERYPLPFSPTAEQLTVPPTPLITSLFGLDAEAIRRFLVQSTEPVRHRPVMKIRDVILTYQPAALVHDKRQWSLEMERGSKSDASKTKIYLHGAQDPIRLGDFLAGHRFPDHELIEEFYRHFYGIAISPTEDFHHGFIRPDMWLKFETLGWEISFEEFGVDRRWLRSLLIFSTGTGESVIIDPVIGDTAWAVLGSSSEGPIIPFTTSFGSFLDECAKASQKSLLSLDYYGWAESSVR